MKHISMTEELLNEQMKKVESALKSTNFTAATSVAIDWNEELKPEEKPTIIFTDKTIKMVRALVDECEKEIAWNGTVTWDQESNTYTVDNIIMFPQIVTGTSVDVDETKYAMWLSTLSDDTFNRLRFHGHSHVRMPVNPSGVDTSYQKDMLAQISDFYIYMIFNKNGAMYACIYNIIENRFYDVSDINLDIEINEENMAAKQLIEKYVEEKKYTPATYAKQGMGVYGHYDNGYRYSYGGTYGGRYGSSIYDYEEDDIVLPDAKYTRQCNAPKSTTAAKKKTTAKSNHAKRGGKK